MLVMQIFLLYLLSSCIETVATKKLYQGVKYNHTQAVTVGRCDKGPLWFNINPAPQNSNNRMVRGTFSTHQIVNNSFQIIFKCFQFTDKSKSITAFNCQSLWEESNSQNMCFTPKCANTQQNPIKEVSLTKARC